MNYPEDSVRRLHPWSHWKTAQLLPSGCRPPALLREKQNLPYSDADVRSVTSDCPVCAKYKPQLCKLPTGNLIKAVTLFKRLNTENTASLRTRRRKFVDNRDEYSRFSFACACTDPLATMVIQCLTSVFDFSHALLRPFWGTKKTSTTIASSPAWRQPRIRSRKVRLKGSTESFGGLRCGSSAEKCAS